LTAKDAVTAEGLFHVGVLPDRQREDRVPSGESRSANSSHGITLETRPFRCSCTQLRARGERLLDHDARQPGWLHAQHCGLLCPAGARHGPRRSQLAPGAVAAPGAPGERAQPGAHEHQAVRASRKVPEPT
ncbi:unnamed protein product, partial [Effrenium voratum]